MKAVNKFNISTKSTRKNNFIERRKKKKKNKYSVSSGYGRGVFVGGRFDQNLNFYLNQFLALLRVRMEDGPGLVFRLFAGCDCFYLEEQEDDYFSPKA